MGSKDDKRGLENEREHTIPQDCIIDTLLVSEIYHNDSGIAIFDPFCPILGYTM